MTPAFANKFPYLWDTTLAHKKWCVSLALHTHRKNRRITNWTAVELTLEYGNSCAGDWPGNQIQNQQSGEPESHHGFLHLMQSQAVSCVRDDICTGNAQPDACDA